MSSHPHQSADDPARDPGKTSNTVLLAIDTCGPTGSVALGAFKQASGAHSQQRISLRILATAELPGKSYSALLVSRINEVLRQAQLTLPAVDALIVVNGPGSFTGVRVGVSSAKGLAEGTGRPVIAISRLELLARQAAGDTCAALDAGRGEFYFAVYQHGTLRLEALYTQAEALKAAQDSGLGIVICEPTIAPSLDDARLLAAPTAADALAIGAERFPAAAFEDTAALDGNYLRRPYAEKPPSRAAGV